MKRRKNGAFCEKSSGNGGRSGKGRSMTINKLFHRSMTLVAPELTGYRQRMAQTAGELNRAGELQAQLDVAVTAIFNLVSVLYATDADQRPVNIDVQTQRILLLPLPWGESGAAKWGLRRWEGQCLRRLLLDRGKQRRRLPSLFDYNEYSRQWHVNAACYPDAEAALQWLKNDGPALNEWAAIVQDYRAQAYARMRRIRG